MSTPADTWRRAAAKAQRTKWEDLLLSQIRALGLPEPVREYRFSEDRAWRFDFAWPKLGLQRVYGTAKYGSGRAQPMHLALEVEGITHDGGRHQRVRGFENDADKYLAAAVLGWTVLRVTPRQVKNGAAVRALECKLK